MKIKKSTVDQIQSCLLDIEQERLKQILKWGMRCHDSGTWLKILVEEVGELAQAMLDKDDGGPKEDQAQCLIMREATQVAAVAAAIMQHARYGQG